MFLSWEVKAMGGSGHSEHEEEGMGGCRRDFKEGIERAWKLTGSKCRCIRVSFKENSHVLSQSIRRVYPPTCQAVSLDNLPQSLGTTHFSPLPSILKRSILQKVFIHYKFVSNISELMSQTSYLRWFSKSVEIVSVLVAEISLHLPLLGAYPENNNF